MSTFTSTYMFAKDFKELSSHEKLASRSEEGEWEGRKRCCVSWDDIKLLSVMIIPKYLGDGRWMNPVLWLDKVFFCSPAGFMLWPLAVRLDQCTCTWTQTLRLKLSLLHYLEWLLYQCTLMFKCIFAMQNTYRLAGLLIRFDKWFETDLDSIRGYCFQFWLKIKCYQTNDVIHVGSLKMIACLIATYV